MLEIDSRVAKLDAFFVRAKEPTSSEELRADLARFGAVLVCGFIERSVHAIIVDRLRKKAQPKVLRFIDTHFRRGTNYDCEAICQLLLRFDEGWCENFRNFLANNVELNDAVRSCYDLRNSIAHGGTMSSGLQSIERYYSRVKELVRGLDACVKH